MARISQKDIDYILDNIDILSLVSEYVKLEKRGKNYVGLCPFHSEKTPSFSVSPEKNICHCFGCGGGGNIFQFMAQIESITYAQAITKLGKRLGLDLEEVSTKKTYNLENRLDSMYYAYQMTADYYNYILLNTKEAQGALDYLLKRGLSIDTIKYFNLGYAPDNQQITVDFLKSNHINLDYAANAGIIAKSEDRYYDLFRDRIIFPIKDNIGRVVAFSGRRLSNDDTIPKYYNTQETDIFEKRKILYNFSDARQFITKENNIILLEGYMDVIRSHQEGVKNVVALMGTNLDDEKIKELTNLCPKISILLDNDKAGEKASIKIGDKLLQNSDHIYKIEFSGAKDIDEFLQEKSIKNQDFSYKDYIKSASKHYIEFKINYYNTTYSNIEEKINYKNDILNSISLLADESLKDILLSELSKQFNIERKTLVLELAKYKKRKHITNEILVTKENISQIYHNRSYDDKLCKLFKYFFSDRAIFLNFYAEMENLTFEDNLYKKLFDMLVIYYNNYSNFQVHKFINNIDDMELSNLVNYIESEHISVEETISIDVVFDYIAYYKNEIKHKKELEIIKSSLKNAAIELDYERQISILQQLSKFKK